MLPTSLRPLAFCLTLLGPTMLVATAALSAETPQTTTAVGAWDLTLDQGARQCRLMLRGDVVASGYGIGMPVGCHLAFPFLASVKTWTEGGDGKLLFDDAKGQPLLMFEAGAEGTWSATGPEGEALHLSSVGAHRPVVLKSRPAESRNSLAKAEVASPAAPKLPLPSVAEMAGHYSVLRKAGRDTGCMVTLDDKSHGPSGSLKANLAPACRDQGIVIFDPVGWQLQAGRLVLTARKGHSAKFDLQSDGTWTKDAKDAVGLSLKKM